MTVRLKNVTFDVTQSNDTDWSIKDVIEDEEVRKYLENVDTYAVDVIVTARHESGLSADSALGGVLLSDRFDLQDWVESDSDYYEQMKEEAYQSLVDLAQQVRRDIRETT